MLVQSLKRTATELQRARYKTAQAARDDVRSVEELLRRENAAGDARADAVTALRARLTSLRSQLAASEQRIRDLEGERDGVKTQYHLVVRNNYELIAEAKAAEARVTLAEREVAEGKKVVKQLREMLIWFSWRTPEGATWTNEDIDGELASLGLAAPVDGPIEGEDSHAK